MAWLIIVGWQDDQPAAACTWRFGWSVHSGICKKHCYVTVCDGQPLSPYSTECLHFLISDTTHAKLWAGPCIFGCAGTHPDHRLLPLLLHVGAVLHQVGRISDRLVLFHSSTCGVKRFSTRSIARLSSPSSSRLYAMPDPPP
eukprot:4782381-Prymnesium_polylepis.4